MDPLHRQLIIRDLLDLNQAAAQLVSCLSDVCAGHVACEQILAFQKDILHSKVRLEAVRLSLEALEEAAQVCAESGR